ncbi:MAG TPA: molybdopterin-dependent oxidoreductase [Casimicrobiaceae bacterium]|nr:molybdopterin-dependent oxidoreductase [Casimicrobiaceae bacterium]
MARNGGPIAQRDSRVVRTMCPMNCHPTLCGMLVEVRDRKLVSVAGDESNPDSQGFLCVRGQASRQVIDNPGRLLYPHIRDRRGGEFRRATWDEALDRIAASMSGAAPEASAIWPGHGVLTTNYGTRIAGQLLSRFAHLYGCQYWNPTMICWGLGAFGLALTGPLETNTKEDMGEHSRLIILWGANLTSQPNTARHLLAAKRRGARIVTIDVRRTEAAAKSDDVLIIRPGTDAALALAMMNVICAEGRHDAAFVAAHTTGFDALARHLAPYSPAWAEDVTGIPAIQVLDLARRYAAERPAMIVLGGSSMHKGNNGWEASRAIACLPALTGNIGTPGGGFGPRHGSAAHGRGLGSIVPPDRRPQNTLIPNQMTAISAALRNGSIRTLLLPGTNMLSSFAASGEIAEGLSRTDLVVCHDLFLSETARRCADIVLPGTAWLEELGCKMTHTHLYLMEQALSPPGETRSLRELMKALAVKLSVDDYHPWNSEEVMIDAILDHRCTGHATIAALRAEGGIRALNVSHVAHPTLDFNTPSRKIEFHSTLAERLGLSALPTYAKVDATGTLAGSAFPLTLTQGRTLAHFHAFYDSGRALPMLAKQEPQPVVWMAPADAASRGIGDGAAIRVFNLGGELAAKARVTDRMPTGVVWTRDGWPELNRLTTGDAVLPDDAVDVFEFSAGQARFASTVEVASI